jgi:hypothetical protein
MPQLIPLNGRRFGRLLVIARHPSTNASKKVVWKCQCDCGAIKFVMSQDLITGHTLSCGCLRDEKCRERNSKMVGSNHPGFTHGASKTAEWFAYKNAKYRCRRKRCKSYKDYGGRGIKFLFKNLGQFLAELGPKPSKKHTLDRIDNDGNYEPGNVRWATKSQQNQNKRYFPRRKS